MDVIASPSVRKRAGDLGLDLVALARDLGRQTITADDLAGGGRNAGGAGNAPAAPGPQTSYWEVDHGQFGAVHEEPVSRFNQAAIRNLSAANAVIPQVTHHDEADISAVEAFRAGLKAEAAERGMKLTALAFHVLALARTLRAHPEVNASLSADANTLITKDYVHIAIAVDTPHGLMVPVIRDADAKGLWQIAAEIADLAARAQARKLGPHEMGGASMTISSLGGIGGSAFTPLVNPPELAILGITRTQMRPHWTGESFEPRPMLPLDLSYDHRAINGALAARVLTTFKALLETPRRMLL